MNRFATAVAATTLALAGTVVAAAPASAGDRICTGRLGAVAIDGNLIVPSGAACTLNGTRIDGNVLVKRNASLNSAHLRVGGNIQADGARYARTVYSYVDGSIQLKNGSHLALERNTVNGDIQLFSNRSGTKVVNYNRVDGNLQCKSNAATLSGRGNVVEGNKEDQCRRF